MPQKATLFLNRNSGTKADTDDLIAAAGEKGVDVIDIAQCDDCAREIRQRMQRGGELFIASGGDGTIHHVMQALVNTSAVLAVIPSGTYNHFARDLGIPLDWREALDVALEGATRHVDVARVNERFFVNNVSLGLYPELVARREARGRDYPRWKARLYATYATLRRYKHVTLAIETDVMKELIRTHVFMVSNNSYDIGRIGIEAPRESLSDGRLSVYWLPHTSRVRMMRFVARYMAGRVRQTPGFRSFRTTRLRVQSSHHALKVGVDGELFTIETPLVITILPQALTVRVPRKEE